MSELQFWVQFRYSCGTVPVQLWYSLGTVPVQCQTVPRYSWTVPQLYRIRMENARKKWAGPVGSCWKFQKMWYPCPEQVPNVWWRTDQPTRLYGPENQFFHQNNHVLVKIIKNPRLRDQNRHPEKKIVAPKNFRSKNQKYTPTGETYSTESSQLPRSSENEPRGFSPFFGPKKRLFYVLHELAL